MNEPRQEPEQAQPKIGAGHAPAMLRMGGKELSAVIAAFPDSIQPISEFGIYGNPLPSEIADAKKMPQMETNHNIGMEM